MARAHVEDGAELGQGMVVLHALNGLVVLRDGSLKMVTVFLECPAVRARGLNPADARFPTDLSPLLAFLELLSLRRVTPANCADKSW